MNLVFPSTKFSAWFSRLGRRQDQGSIQESSRTATVSPRISDFGFRISDFASPPPLLQFTGLMKRYGSVEALAGVDLSVPRGSVLALLGPNGAGKSTLFGCLLGLVRPTAGAICFHGEPMREEHRLKFGYVAERIALHPHRTVNENGLFFCGLRGHSPAELEHQLQRVGLHSIRERLVTQLSKGMLQRLGLAIALCGKPELLVLDEPFNGLDPALLEDLQGILREENERGATLLIATHTISAVEQLATDVAILLNGQLALCGRLERLREQFCCPSLETIYHQVARQHRANFGTEVTP